MHSGFSHTPRGRQGDADKVQMDEAWERRLSKRRKGGQECRPFYQARMP